MLIRKIALTAASTLLMTSAAFAADVDVDKSAFVDATAVDVRKTEVDVKQNVDVEIDKSKTARDSFNKTLEIDKSQTAKDSFNNTSVFESKSSFDSKSSSSFDSSTHIDRSIFAKPVAVGVLKGAVTKNAVISQVAVAANTDLDISSSAFQGFTGVNNGNINAGANSLQQSNVSIAVVSTRVP
jgi:hypothetical protein